MRATWDKPVNPFDLRYNRRCLNNSADYSLINISSSDIDKAESILCNLATINFLKKYKQFDKSIDKLKNRSGPQKLDSMLGVRTGLT